MLLGLGRVVTSRPFLLFVPGAAWALVVLLAATTSAASARVQPAALIGPPLPSVSAPLPLPTVPVPTVSVPPAPPLPVPTPSLPVSVTPSPPTLPTPSLPVSLSPTPPGLPSPLQGSPSPSPAGGAGGGPRPAGGNGGPGHGSGGSGPGGGITIPFTTIVVRSPIDAALLGAVGVLPILFAIWLLLFGRTWNEARRSRDAQMRLAIAHDLGLSPRELQSVSTKGLFKLREEAAFDELTGVLRRAAGISALDREVHRSRRQKSPLAVVFIDVDGLKAANDKRGHKAGDQMLRTLSAALKSGLRGQDLVMRYGGDEFVCILPDTTAEAGRAKMSSIQADAEKAGVNFSSGVAELARSDDVVSLLGRADTEMYAVKSRRGVVRDIRLGVVGAARGGERPFDKVGA